VQQTAAGKVHGAVLRADALTLDDPGSPFPWSPYEHSKVEDGMVGRFD
jgi:hypothetical protein